MAEEEWTSATTGSSSGLLSWTRPWLSCFVHGVSASQRSRIPCTANCLWRLRTSGASFMQIVSAAFASLASTGASACPQSLAEDMQHVHRAEQDRRPPSLQFDEVAHPPPALLHRSNEDDRVGPVFGSFQLSVTMSPLMSFFSNLFCVPSPN